MSLSARFAYFFLVASLLLSAGSAAAENVNPTAPTGDPSTWKAEIKAQYEAIRTLPAMPKEPVIAAVTRLAGQGKEARPALAALAADVSLPEPQRAMSGIMGTFFIPFDVSALRSTVITGTNSFARRQAVDFLAQIGGSQIRVFLDEVGKQETTLTAYIAKALVRAPETEAIREEDRNLLSDILMAPAAAKERAMFALVKRHEGDASMDPWLGSLLNSPVADDDTKIQAAIAIAKIHTGSVPELKALTARNKQRFLRYNAVLELASKGPAGEAVLRELLVAPDEPLRKQIEACLAKK